MDRPEQILGCVGYYGFGGGWVSAKSDIPGESYCVRCPAREECWTRHEARVTAMFPEISLSIEKLSADTGKRGMELHAEFERRWRTQSPSISVMRGNIEDGISVGDGGFPANRDRFTLPYPFKAEQRQ